MDEERFQFPLNETDYSIITDVEDLRNRVRCQASQLSLKHQYFQLHANRHSYQRYIYARCIKCSAMMKFKLDSASQKYTLYYFSNNHYHKSSNDQNAKIIEFIKGLGTQMNHATIQNLTKYAFSISDAKFKYLYYKSWKSNKDFNYFLEDYDKKGFHIRTDPYPLPPGSFPDLILLAAPYMLDNFQKFGQFCSFDVTYNLIKQYKVTQNRRKKKWGLSLFLGKNDRNKAIPFGICILNSQMKKDFIHLFLSFFQVVKGQPQTILTDEQSSIISALKQLNQSGQWNGNHIFDTFHVLKNLKKRTKNQDLLSCLKNAMYATSVGQYTRHISLAQQCITTHSDKSAIEQFRLNQSKYCISMTPASFHGITLSTSYHQKVHDMIKQKIQYERPFTFVLQKIIKIMEQMQSNSVSFTYSKIPMEDYLNDPHIKFLRYTLCQPIFKQIIKRYIEAIKLSYDKIDDQWLFKQRHMEQLVHQGPDLLECTCKYRQKTGIPCKHVIKVLLTMKKKIAPYIHGRWKISEPKITNQVQICMGRPRISRRNRVR